MMEREYDDRVWEVELASFALLVFATIGGMGKEASVFHCQQADLLDSKHGWTYNTTLSWVCCVLAFSLLRSAIIWGSRFISFRSSSASAEMGPAMRPIDCLVK